MKANDRGWMRSWARPGSYAAPLQDGLDAGGLRSDGAVGIRRAKKMSRGTRADAGKEQPGNRTTFALIAGWKLNKSFTQRRGGAAAKTQLPTPILTSAISASARVYSLGYRAESLGNAVFRFKRTRSIGLVLQR